MTVVTMMVKTVHRMKKIMMMMVKIVHRMKKIIMMMVKIVHRMKKIMMMMMVMMMMDGPLMGVDLVIWRMSLVGPSERCLTQPP